MTTCRLDVDDQLEVLTAAEAACSGWLARFTRVDHDEATSLLWLLLDAVRAGEGVPGGLLARSADAAVVGAALEGVAAVDRLVVDDVSGHFPGRTSYTVTAADRLWVVVIRTDAAKLIELVTVFARPEPFSGVPGGFVVCIGGASSAGKSSLMAAMCEQASTPWTRFDERSIGTTPMRFLIWAERSGPLAEGFFAAVARFAQTGNQVVLSCTARDGRERFPSMPRLYVHLDCPLETLVQRERTRHDRWPGLAEETYALASASRDDYDLQLDSSANSPTELASVVLEAVTRRQKINAAACTG